MLSQHTTTGFNGAPVSKFLTEVGIVSHLALHIPMFSGFKNMLHCHLPRKFWLVFNRTILKL